MRVQIEVGRPGIIYEMRTILQYSHMKEASRLRWWRRKSMAKLSGIVMMIVGSIISLLSMIPIYFFLLAIIDSVKLGSIYKYSIDFSREYNAIILIMSSTFLLLGIFLFIFGFRRMKKSYRND